MPSGNLFQVLSVLWGKARWMPAICASRSRFCQKKVYRTKNRKVIDRQFSRKRWPRTRPVHIRPALKSALTVAASLKSQFEQNRALNRESEQNVSRKRESWWPNNLAKHKSLQNSKEVTEKRAWSTKSTENVQIRIRCHGQWSLPRTPNGVCTPCHAPLHSRSIMAYAPWFIVQFDGRFTVASALVAGQRAGSGSLQVWMSI